LTPKVFEIISEWTQGVEALPPVPGAAAHLHLKGHTQKLCVFAQP